MQANNNIIIRQQEFRPDKRIFKKKNFMGPNKSILFLKL